MTRIVFLVNERRVSWIVERLETEGREESRLAEAVMRAKRERGALEIGGRFRRVLAIHSNTRPGSVVVDVDHGRSEEDVDAKASGGAVAWPPSASERSRSAHNI